VTPFLIFTFLVTANIWLLKQATFVGLVTCGVICFEIKIYVRYERTPRPLSVHTVVTFVCLLCWNRSLHRVLCACTLCFRVTL